MNRNPLSALIKDTRISFDASIVKMPMPSGAFLRRIRETVDFGRSTYAHEAMNLLCFLPFKQSRGDAYDFVIRIHGRSHYYSETNAMRHIYNILFQCMHPLRPKFNEAHSTIRELVLLAYCDNARLAARVFRGRWNQALPYISALEYCPDIKIHLLKPRDIHIIMQSVKNGDPFTVDTGAKMVLALRVMFNKAVQEREHHGFNHEYADRVFDIFLSYIALENEPVEPGFAGQLEAVSNSRHSFAMGPESGIHGFWDELVRLVQTRDGAHWTKAVVHIQKFMYEMASGVARVFNFIAKRENYAQFNASQMHTQEEVAFARGFATACMLINKLASFHPLDGVAASSLQAPPAAFVDFQCKQMLPRNMADFYTIVRLFDEQVYHFLHRSWGAHMLEKAKAHPHGCVWILVRGVAAERLRAIIHASMTHRDMEQFVLCVGEIHDPHLGFGAVIGLKCWYDGESAKTDAISLFSLVLTTKVRARNFAFPGYTVPIYPFVARLLLNMPMNTEWAPAALALGVLPGFAARPYAASYESLKMAFRAIGMVLFLAIEKPDKLPNPKVGRFINNMLWHLGAPQANNLIIIHEDMPRVAAAVKRMCLRTPSACGRAKKFLVFLNEEARRHENRGYTALGVWTSFLTHEITSWTTMAQCFLLSKPGAVSSKDFDGCTTATADAMSVLFDCVIRKPKSPQGRRVSLASGSEPSTPRQTKIGMLPSSMAGNVSVLMSPLVRRSSTPTHERGPFRSFNPNYKSELDLPFGRVLGLVEHINTDESLTGNEIDFDSFDVRTARLDLIPFHQTALCMVSPLTSIGLPELDNLSQPLDNGLHWCISSAAAATIYRHQRFKPEFTQLQENRNKSLWNMGFGSVEDMIEEDRPDDTPPAAYARPEPQPMEPVKLAPVEPVGVRLQANLMLHMPRPTNVPEQFFTDSEDEEEDPMMWSDAVGRPAPAIAPPSPVFDDPVYPPKSPVYPSPDPPVHGVVQRAAAAADMSQTTTSRKRRQAYGNGLATQKKKKKTRHHTRPTHNALSPEQRRHIAEGRMVSSIPRTLAQVANVAGSHHEMKLMFE